MKNDLLSDRRFYIFKKITLVSFFAILQEKRLEDHIFCKELFFLMIAYFSFYCTAELVQRNNVGTKIVESNIYK